MTKDLALLLKHIQTGIQSRRNWLDSLFLYTSVKPDHI